MDERAERLAWFKSAILPYEGEVASRLRRLCPQGFDVENLVAESLIRAYAAKDFTRLTAGRSYLFAIARNLLLDAARRNKVVSLDFVADLDVLRSDSSLEACLSARDELRRLSLIIDTLPQQPRRVFILRRIHDYSPADIAAQLGLSVSTVEKHLAKAIQLVAKGWPNSRKSVLSDPPKGKTDGPALDRLAIEELASAHLAKLLGSPTEAERRAIEEWLDVDLRHAVAFAKMEAAWESAGRLRAKASDFDATSPSLGDWLRRPGLIAAAAACLAGACLAGGWLYSRDVDLYRTKVGERRLLRLADGSTIQLNTASTVEVAFRKHLRQVRLVRGEAEFRVAHDPSRPFVVAAAAARFRAVGTAFDVRLRDQAVVELTVTQGVVAVLPAKTRGQDAAAPRITAGSGAVVDGATVAPTPLGSEVLHQRTAWQDGVIEFNGETLGQVVAEFNRYQLHPIVIGDAGLENTRVGGRFLIGESDKFLTAISSTFPILVIHTSEGSVLLTRRAEKSSAPG